MTEETTDIEMASEGAVILVGDLAAILGIDGEADAGAIGRRIAEIQASNAEISEQLATVTADRDQLQAANANLVTELDKAVARYQVHRRKHEGKGRPIGALKAVVDPADIAAAIEAPVELVFSDGKKEIPAIDPVHVSGGAAWSRHPTGMMLRDRVLLAGPAPGERAFSVAGVGLLVDGKQIGWCAFHDVVSVPGGATAELRDSIIF